MKYIHSPESFLFAILVATVFAINDFIHPAINLCKRNDPKISDCYCTNVKTMIPILKDGIPNMGIPAIEPFRFNGMYLDFTQSQTLQIEATLLNITAHGLIKTQIPHCNLQLVDTGLETQLNFELSFLALTSFYNAAGNFANFKINATGDFHAEFRDLLVRTHWKGIKYMNNNKEYLKFYCHIEDFLLGDVKIHFNKIFENNPQMDEVVNEVISENIHVLIEEVKPITVDIIKSVATELSNDISESFPFDEIFPLE